MFILGLAENLNFNVKCKEQLIKSHESIRYLGLSIDKIPEL